MHTLKVLSLGSAVVLAALTVSALWAPYADASLAAGEQGDVGQLSLATALQDRIETASRSETPPGSMVAPEADGRQREPVSHADEHDPIPSLATVLRSRGLSVDALELTVQEELAFFLDGLSEEYDYLAGIQNRAIVDVADQKIAGGAYEVVALGQRFVQSDLADYTHYRNNGKELKRVLVSRNDSDDLAAVHEQIQDLFRRGRKGVDDRLSSLR